DHQHVVVAADQGDGGRHEGELVGHHIGVGRPSISEPDPKRAVPLLMTVTAPGPYARHRPSCQTAALRSSTPSSTTSSRGAAPCALSTHRRPNVSKCGSTAALGTRPSAGRYWRRSSPGI